MDEQLTVKRRPGRPRLDPQVTFHARLPPALKARIERDAKRHHRSITREFERRLEESYISDKNYGGPQMAAMFREMAAAAFVVESRDDRGSFFEDYETFALLRIMWLEIIQKRAPPPNAQAAALEVARLAKLLVGLADIAVVLAK